jgi:MinD-like ATPase involved in chromosome partitioning or flagellar assembly
MYVVTFYSFKGGVGRSMALVNVGVKLAISGRRVLLVDFDLEAPGLTTFDQLKIPTPTGGVVDFVCDYLANGRAPDFRDHVFKSQMLASEKGGLWVMPAGRRDAEYSQRLGTIDWQRLYAELDGYLLFEDLKAQWEAALQPDYVLIDSRTGYTDVAGICTRQLPDATVLLFFPNEQNLQGLREVVGDIRREEHGPQQKAIKLHFVTSNVPDLDDEDEILAGRISQFKRLLQYDNLSATIHHYDSLSLLNQAVFTYERPKSRLAREYESLCSQIVRANLSDREGAMDFLRNLGEVDGPVRDWDLNKNLEFIHDHYDADGEVLSNLARIQFQLGRNEEALSLYNEAASKGFEDAALLLARARLNLATQRSSLAQADAERLLELSSAGFFQVHAAVRLLLQLHIGSLKTLAESNAFNSLSPFERLEIVDELAIDRLLLPVIEEILRRLSSSNDANTPAPLVAQLRSMTYNPWVLCLIGQRKFVEAMEMIDGQGLPPNRMPVYDAFNYGMARWGKTGLTPHDCFKRVVECDQEMRLDKSLNQMQCAAIAYWAIGEVEEAARRIKHAKESISARKRREFSAWRYLKVTPSEFRTDIEAIMAMVKGEDVSPSVFGI